MTPDRTYLETIERTLEAYDQGRPEDADADAGDALHALGRLLLDRTRKQAAASNACQLLKEIEEALGAEMTPTQIGGIRGRVIIARIYLEVAFDLGDGGPVAATLATKEGE